MNTTIEVKRGGHAIMYIYGFVILMAVLIAKFFGITNPYFFMGFAVFGVAAGYFLMPIIFSKAIITADETGVSTAKLGQVVWKDVSKIYVERVPRWYTQGLAKEDIYLIIKTVDNKSHKLNVMFFAEGEPIANKLVEFWNSKTLSNPS